MPAKETNDEKRNRIKASLIRVGVRKELCDISMYDVASEAKMSPSTVYHYYSNINDLIMHYLVDIFNDFERIVRTCTDELDIIHWRQINRAVQTSLSAYCDENAMVKKILYTHHQYSDVKNSIVEKDNQLGKEIENLYHRYFQLPPLPDNYNIFTIALEASDSVYFSRNVGIEDIAISSESITVSESYLSRYLPDYLTRIAAPQPCEQQPDPAFELVD